MLYHIKGYELRFYDNLKDTETVAKISEKRSIEKDNTLSEDDFQKLHGEQIFRIEFRFHRSSIIKKEFQDVAIEAQLTFQNLFN